MGRFTKGLHRDTHPADQPEGTWRYARNAVMNRVDGALSNERGTLIGPMIGKSPGYKVIGAIETTNDDIILFSVNRYTWIDPVSGPNQAAPDYGRSEVGILNSNDEYVTILNVDPWHSLYLQLNENDTLLDTDLRFNAAYPITGTYKINANGDLIVYWTDNLNPPRSLNVTRQSKQGLNAEEPYELIYDKPFMSTNNKKYVDTLNLFVYSGPVPNINLHSVTSGGGLPTGAYHLALAYIDEDLTSSNYVIIDNPVSIVEDVETVKPIERYDGSPPASPSGKSIQWRVNNINKDYKYLRPAVIQSIGDQKFAFKLHDVEISTVSADGIISISFSGTEGYISLSVEDVIVNEVSYTSAKCVSQLDDVLYLGNLSGSKDIGFQVAAGNIVLTPTVKTISNFDPYSLITDNIENGFIEIDPLDASKRNGYRDPYMSYKMRGYIRGEVYAFYIAFILNDGSMSYAYHIPGRESIQDELNDLPAAGGDVVNQEGVSNLGNTKNFHFKSYSEEPGSNDMNYWENENETYPDTPNFSHPHFKNDDGTMANVRHHHFPKNTDPRYKVVVASNTTTPVAASPLVPNWVTFVIDDIAVTDNDIFDLGITWLDEHGNAIPFTDFNHLTAYHVTDYPSVPQIGEQYNIVWQFSNTGFGTDGDYPGEVISIQEDSDWILVSHEQHMLDLGFPLGGIISDLLSDLFASADFPNDSNFDVAVGTPFEGGTMNLMGQSPSGANQIVAGGTVSDTVQVLGFDLKKIHIPRDMFAKVQGFRIYHAKRDHTDKRILGQGPVIPYIKWLGRLGGCPLDEGESVSSTQHFWIKRPLDLGDHFQESTIVQHAQNDYPLLSFYNFELLRTHNTISSATHISVQWEAEAWAFVGPGVSHELDVDSACNFELIRSNFYVSKEYTANTQDTYHTIKERCKTFVEGNTILNATSAGFGYRLYNRGGETHIGLALNEAMAATYGGQPASGILANSSDYSSLWLKSARSRFSVVNLEAFKTDVYNSLDSQTLVWTGFQVVGEDLLHFTAGALDMDGMQYVTDNEDQSTHVIQQNSSSLYFSESTSPEIPLGTYQESVHGAAAPVHFEHGIFGGDAFICRYGFRQSIMPRINTHHPQDHVAALLTIIESTDNINFRHEEDKRSAYVPGSSFREVAISDRDGKNFDVSQFFDLTARPALTYNEDYSLVNDISPAFALPNLVTAPTDFTTRVQRSAKSSPGSLIDNFRVFLANDYKDMPKNRGDLWNLATFNNLLYIHMEDSLLLTKGKQSMQLKDGSEAFIGSGDIFAQDPDELLQTDEGYGGTHSQFACITTKYGYFFVDSKNGKVFMATDKLVEISKLGLEHWFKENIDDEKWNFKLPDSPIVGVGFVTGWDEKHERLLLTKRALLPSAEGKKFFTTTEGGRLVTSGRSGLRYDSSKKAYILRVYPGVRELINGDFLYGNEMLPITSFSTATDFSSSEVAPANFYWTIARDFGTRSLSSGVFALAYSSKNPYFILEDITLDANKGYVLDIDWKGEQGVKLVISGVGLPNDVIFEDTTNKADYSVSTAAFTTGYNTTYSLKVYGGGTEDSGTLNVRSVSLKDQKYDGWEYDSGWSITGNQIVHSGAGTSNLSQSVSSERGVRVTTFSVSNVTDTSGELSVHYGADRVLTLFGTDANGTHTISKPWLEGNYDLMFTAKGGFDGALDDISCHTLPESVYIVTSTDYRVDTSKFSVANSGEFIDVDVPTDINTALMQTPTAARLGERDDDDDDPDVSLVYAANLFTRVGWTVSYYPETKIWGSFHDYIPHLYSHRSGAGRNTGMCSFYNWEELPLPFWSTTGIGNNPDLSVGEGTYDVWTHSWRSFVHNDVTAPGRYYYVDKEFSGLPVSFSEALTNPFEVEAVINPPKFRDVSKSFFNISYESEVFKRAMAADFSEARYKRLDKDGFTSFFVYNSTQHSSNTDIVYLQNVRKVAHKWQINKFRDMANLYTTTFVAAGGIDFTSLSQEINPVYYSPDGTLTSGFQGSTSDNILTYIGASSGPTALDWVGNQDTHDMFEATWGVNGIYGINTHSFYIDTEKVWNLQKKFVDTYVGIRLISNNFNKNFVNLYSYNAGMRKYLR